MDSITLTLKDYLEGGYVLPENIDSFLTLDLVDVEYNIRDLFTKRNLFKEIGSETEDLFKHNLDVLIDEALSKFNPQLKLLQDNFNKLMDRKVAQLSSGESSEESEGDTTNSNYLNPANSNAQRLTDKAPGNMSGSVSKSYSESRERVFGYFKTNPEMLKTANECFNVVVDILKYLDKAFIGEY